MRYGVKFTSYRIKSVSNSLDQTVEEVEYPLQLDINQLTLEEDKNPDI